MSHPVAGAVGPLVSEPLLAAGLALAGGLYAIGLRRLATRASGRGGLPAWRVWCYAAGLGTLAIATLSPLHAWGERLLAIHMAQHLLLAVVAPPLLWLGAPLVPTLWGLPRPARRAVARLLAPRHLVRQAAARLARPLVAAPLHVATVALWHWPPLYDAAQGGALAHDLEHALFLGTALLYWWPVVYPVGGRRPLATGPALVYLVPPMVAGDAIGALLSFAPEPLYATYAGTMGLSALADQRVAGLVMWVGGGLLWLAGMGAVLFCMPDPDAARLRQSPALHRH